MATWTSLVFLSLTVLRFAVDGRPNVVKRGTYVIGELPRVPANIPRCVRFEHPYCNKFANTTLSENPARDDYTVEERVAEFQHWVPLLEQECHENLLLFLCYTYFPLCDESINVDRPETMNEALEKVIFPCQDTCQSVHNSRCTDILKNSAVKVWAPHTQCNRNTTQGIPVFPAFGTQGRPCAQVPSEPDDTKSKEPKEIGSGEEIDESPTKSKIPTEPEPCPEDCPKRSFRANCNSKTFERNCEYEFAARVNITDKVSSSCDDITIYASIIEDNTTHAANNQSYQCTRAPDSPIEIQTRWRDDCTQCPNIKVGSQYLIAGHYSLRNGIKVYSLDCKSLWSEWDINKGRYEKKLHKWVKNTERGKCANTFCFIA